MNTIRRQDVEHILAERLPWERLFGKTVLVTGANGFIPSYIVDVLLTLSKVRVLAVVRNLDKAHTKFKHWSGNENLKIIAHDVSLPISLDEHVDIIIHAASQASPKYYGVDPVGTLKANTLGTYWLLELAKSQNIDKFMYFSSGEVYGTLDQSCNKINEEYAGNINCSSVRSCYGESKRMGENMCVCYSHQYNIPVNMIRLSHTYGPGVQLDDGRVFGDFVSNVINNENIVLNSDGSAKRCFCYISDMVRAFFYILFNGENATPYNIATDVETSILDLANCLVELYPEKNLSVKFNENVFKPGYIRSASSRASFSIDRVKDLGWTPKICVSEGFKRMIDSYLE